MSKSNLKRKLKMYDDELENIEVRRNKINVTRKVAKLRLQTKRQQERLNKINERLG